MQDAQVYGQQIILKPMFDLKRMQLQLDYTLEHHCWAGMVLSILW